MIDTIFGGAVATPAGYCGLHNGGLTVKQLRKRHCLDKQCWYLVRNEEHPWWEQRAAHDEFR